MKVKGDEPPLPGHTNEDALNWCIDSIRECLPAAEKAGVILPGDPYPEIEKIAPNANIVHFKTYFGGGVWYTLDLDYPRIAKILRQANFKGYVSLEMEGNEPAATAVPKSLELMRQVLG